MPPTKFAQTDQAIEIRHSTGLLKTCRFARNEASPIFYGNVDFRAYFTYWGNDLIRAWADTVPEAAFAFLSLALGIPWAEQRLKINIDSKSKGVRAVIESWDSTPQEWEQRVQPIVDRINVANCGLRKEDLFELIDICERTGGVAPHIRFAIRRWHAPTFMGHTHKYPKGHHHSTTPGNLVHELPFEEFEKLILRLSPYADTPAWWKFSAS